MSLVNKLMKWSENGLLSPEQVENILAYEKENNRPLFFWGLGGLGVLSLIFGIASLVASNWHLITPEMRIGGHVLLNLFLAGITIKFFKKPSWGREVLVALQAGLVLTFIALIGQTLQSSAPLWQPLGLWLLLATPMMMLYTRFSGLVVLWFGVLCFVTVSFCDQEFSQKTTISVATALPFVLYLLFSLNKAKEHMGPWSQTTKRLFWFVVVVITSMAQFLWDSNTIVRELIETPTAFIKTAGIGVLACVALSLLQRAKLLPFWEKMSVDWSLVLVVSYAFTVAPLLVSYTQIPALGAVLFCVYWLLVGAMGLKTGHEKLWSLAVILVGLRIFSAYIEIMGSLATQGFRFIGTGVFFLLLAWTTKRLMKNKPAWLAPSQSDKEA